MSYKNPKELLTAAAALPAAIEEKLPAGAPKVSTKLLEATNKLPDLPDFIIEFPNLPAVPEFPELPGATLRRYVTDVEVRPAAPSPPPTKPLGEEILS